MAAAELLALAGVRGSVPMGGSSTNHPPTPAFPPDCGVFELHMTRP